MKKKRKRIPEIIGKRWLKITDSIFKQRVHVLLNYTPEDYAKWLTKVGAKDVSNKSFDNFSGFSSSMEKEGEPDQYIVYVKNFNWAIKCQGTLIHEIVHTIIKIFDANNIPYNLDTQEFLAQEVSNMYEEIAEKLLVKV